MQLVTLLTWRKIIVSIVPISVHLGMQGVSLMLDGVLGIDPSEMQLSWRWCKPRTNALETILPCIILFNYNFTMHLVSALDLCLAVVQAPRRSYNNSIPYISAILISMTGGWCKPRAGFKMV